MKSRIVMLIAVLAMIIAAAMAGGASAKTTVAAKATSAAFLTPCAWACVGKNVVAPKPGCGFVCHENDQPSGTLPELPQLYPWLFENADLGSVCDDHGGVLYVTIGEGMEGDQLVTYWHIVCEDLTEHFIAVPGQITQPMPYYALALWAYTDDGAWSTDDSNACGYVDGCVPVGQDDNGTVWEYVG